MIPKDELTGPSGARRVYRFHLGWSVAGRANHFNLTSPIPHRPRCVVGTEIRHTACEANPPLPKRD